MPFQRRHASTGLVPYDILPRRSLERGGRIKHATLQVPAKASLFRLHEQRASRPAFRAQLLPQELDGELIRTRDSGRRRDDVDHDVRLHEGKAIHRKSHNPTRVR